MARWVRHGQIVSLVELGRVAEAEERHEEFLVHFPTGAQHDLGRLVWARVHLMQRNLATASEALRACSPMASMLTGRYHLYCEALRCFQGDGEALERLRAWLETPEGAPLRTVDRRLLQMLGVGTSPVMSRISAFGALQFQGRGGTPIRWGRRKAMLLFAHLLLRPEGISPTELAERFFGDEAETPPLQALHFVVHTLRQALKGIGQEARLDTSQGIIRLERDGIAFCDLFEFDAFYERARSFEADGYHQLAAVFFSIALCHARGELFENLPEDFAEARAAYRQRMRYAQAHAERHAP